MCIFRYISLPSCLLTLFGFPRRRHGSKEWQMGPLYPPYDHRIARRHVYVLSGSHNDLTSFLHVGMEAVIFVGGVSLGQPATSIPLATVVGLICGLVCGFLIYSFASRTSKSSCLWSHTCLFTYYYSCSSHRLPDLHDQLHLAYWCRSLQPCHRRFPGAEVQHPVSTLCPRVITQKLIFFPQPRSRRRRCRCGG